VTFESALAFVRGPSIEGGYSDRKEDRGGPTMNGMTQPIYDVYRKAHKQELQPVKFIEEHEIVECYKTYFWDAGKCLYMPEPLSLVHFDSMVQHRPKACAGMLQQALGVKDDGIIGPATMKALLTANIPQVVEDYIDSRQVLYDTIVEHDRTQQANYNGWKNRLHLLRAEVAKFYRPINGGFE
jgi:lysozyme family protein